MQTYFSSDSNKKELLKSKSSFKDFSHAYFKTASDLALKSNNFYEFSKNENITTNNLNRKICKNFSATMNLDTFLKTSPFAKLEKEVPFNYTGSVKSGILKN